MLGDYYCTGCGAKLVEDYRWQMSFSQYTGKPNCYVHLKCPNDRGWWDFKHPRLTVTVDDVSEIEESKNGNSNVNQMPRM